MVILDQYDIKDFLYLKFCTAEQFSLVVENQEGTRYSRHTILVPAL